MTRQRAFIPFSSWSPDAGLLRNPGMFELENAAAFQGRLLPAPEAVLVSDGTPGSVSGAHVHLQDDSDAGWKIYVSAKDGLNPYDIFEFDPDTDPWPATSVGKSGGYATVQAEGMLFTSFGQHVIAVGGHSFTPQIRLAGSGGTMAADFADLFSSSTYEPKPKFVAALGSRVVLANCANVGAASDFDPDPNLVFVSKTDNAREYSDPATAPGDRTDYYLLYDNLGKITGLIGGQEFGVLFKERGIYRVEYQGAYGLEFVPVSNSIGSLAPQSPVWIDNDLYFMSTIGPARIRQDTVEPLGTRSVVRALNDADNDLGLNTSFFADVASAISGHYDAGTQTVTWTYLVESENEWVALVYSIPDDAFTLVYDYSVSIRRLVSVPTTDRGFSLWRDAAGLGFAASLKWYRFGKDLGASAIVPGAFRARFPYQAYADSGPTRIVGVRPIITGTDDIPEMSVTVYVKGSPYGEQVTSKQADTSDAGQPDARGYIRVPDAPWGEFHSILLTIAAGTATASLSSEVNELEGIEVEWMTAPDGKIGRRS